MAIFPFVNFSKTIDDRWLGFVNEDGGYTVHYVERLTEFGTGSVFVLPVFVRVGTKLKFISKVGKVERGVVIKLSLHKLSIKLSDGQIFRCEEFTNWDRNSSREAGWFDWKVVAPKH